MESPTDDEIKAILKGAKDIAVVGLSGKLGRARASGLTVVMDRCMMQEHKRLLAEVGR